ncbi:MAG: hypothetical protein Tsb0013_05530 [Phycisphaerales bacterium]
MRTLRPSRAFTLIELLVVIAILSVLVALSITVGALVIRGGNERATQSLLTSLDRALDEYIGINGAPPPYAPTQYDNFPGPDDDLVEYEGVFQPRRPDAAIFIAQSGGVGEVGTIIGNLPERFRFARAETFVGGGPQITTPEAPSILDAWADGVWTPPYNADQTQLVYYVHPDNTLAQDLYGACVNGRPYFLSAGADTLYGLNDDPFIPDAQDGSGQQGNEHTYQTCLAAQADNLTSYPVDPITASAFERTTNAGVR